MASLTNFGCRLRLVTLLAITWAVHAANALSVSSTVLIFARDTASSNSATSGLQGYGIPYQVEIVPKAGITLPELNSSTTEGNYGGIIVLGEAAYDYDGAWASALSSAQWQQLYDYQTAFGVRMVRLDVYPGPNFGKFQAACSRTCEMNVTAHTFFIGVTTAIDGAGCCDAGVDQLVSISDASAFATANLKESVLRTSAKQVLAAQADNLLIGVLQCPPRDYGITLPRLQILAWQKKLHSLRPQAHSPRPLVLPSSTHLVLVNKWFGSRAGPPSGRLHQISCNTHTSTG